MHGITDQAGLPNVAGTSLFQRAISFFWWSRTFLLAVVVPTLLVTGYFVLIAADQYETEAQFLVRSSDEPKQPSIGIGALGISGAPEENTVNITEYLSSHDAVAWLRKNENLVERFRRPEADIFSRLWSPNPTPEALHRYFEKHVQVEIDDETGLVAMRVRAFRPTDSYAIARALLGLGERRVNTLNERMHDAALALARRQLAEAERAVTETQRHLTVFRQRHNNIDPMATGNSQLELVTKLKGALAQVQAQRASMARFLSPDSPQLAALNSQVRAMAFQVDAAQSALSGESNAAIAARVGDYQELQIRQNLATKRYDAAVAQYQRARTDLERQQMYVVQVVDPNLPVKATYPKSLKVIATVFFLLLLAYGIGWLIVAGVREHAA